MVDFAPEQYWIGDQNSFKLNKPSAVFIEAVEDATIVLMDRNFYETAGKINPGYNAFMVSALLNRLSLMQRRINLLLAATAEERYLDFIELFPDVAFPCAPVDGCHPSGYDSRVAEQGKKRACD